MSIIDEFINTSKTGVFWVLLVISVMGVAFAVYLVYKGKDKVASFLISVPFGIMAMFIINLLVSGWFVNVNEMWTDYAIMPGISVLSFSTVVWGCKKFLITLVKKVFRFNVNT